MSCRSHTVLCNCVWKAFLALREIWDAAEIGTSSERKKPIQHGYERRRQSKARLTCWKEEERLVSLYLTSYKLWFRFIRRVYSCEKHAIDLKYFYRRLQKTWLKVNTALESEKKEMNKLNTVFVLVLLINFNCLLEADDLSHWLLLKIIIFEPFFVLVEDHFIKCLVDESFFASNNENCTLNNPVLLCNLHKDRKRLKNIINKTPIYTDSWTSSKKGEDIIPSVTMTILFFNNSAIVSIYERIFVG